MSTLHEVRYERVESDDGDGPSVSAHARDNPDAWPTDRTLAEVGHPRARLDGIDKVTGRARYASDTVLAAQLEGAVLRSPHAHATVRSIDTDRALALPGVIAVYSSASPLSDDIDVRWFAEEVPLFSPVLRYIGDEVALVVAESRRIADAALALIDVDYEVLPHVTDMHRATDSGAPDVHPDGNLKERDTSSRGDAAAALRSADVVIDRTYTTECVVHHALEAHATVANWCGDELSVHESTQGVHAVRDALAETFGLPLSRVRVRCEHMGGGFGAKQVPWKQTLFACLASRRLGRPVRVVLDRRGEALSVGNRNPTSQRVRLGAMRDGTLVAIALDARRTFGAYSPPGESSMVAGLYQYLYRCDNVETRVESVYTHLGPAVAFRAPGYVEACFALESAMDELAGELGLDPLEFRLANYTERDQVQDREWSSPDGLRTAYERLGWVGSDDAGERDRTARASNGTRRVRGRGLAAHEWAAGTGSPPAYARVVIQPDGSVELIVGTQDIGTGTRTVLAQVAAESLGVPLDAVAVRLGDTAAALYAPTSAGSFTTPTMAPTVRRAALDARRELLDAAAMLWHCKPDTLDLRDGEVRGEHDRRATLAELADAIAPHTVQGSGARLDNPAGRTIRPFGAQMAEVEVDLDTGEVVLLRQTAAPDCGRLLNRRTAASQVIGGVTQGIGYALTERRMVDHALGRVMNANLEDYLLPTMLDVPPIDHAEVDLPDLHANHLGVKGLGELPLIPAAPAILNAVHDAIGVRIRSLPLTRGAILDALAQREAAA